MTFLMMLSVILLSKLMILFCTLKCDQASDLWQQPELAFELEPDLRGTVDLGRKWFVISILEKLRLFCFTGLITLVLFK